MYSLRRLPNLGGTGPVIVYRALPNEVGKTQWPVRQSPQSYVQNLPSFREVTAAHERGETAAVAAHLAASGVPEVEKAWTEIIYEAVRREVLPEAPSRLNALWAFADPLEAFAFAERTAVANVVFEARICVGVPWRVVDMGAYYVAEIPEHAEKSFIAMEPAVREAARHYWLFDRPDAEPEVIVGGDLELTSSALTLLSWLRQQGLVAKIKTAGRDAPATATR